MSLTEECVSLFVGDKDGSQRMKGHGRPSIKAKKKREEKKTVSKLLTLCVPLDVIHSSTALHAHLSCARVGLGDIYDPFVF